MTDQAIPSEWENKRFGELALPLRDAVWRALEAAHRRALAAHLAFGLDTSDVYGQLWLVQNQELAAELEGFADVWTVKPKRARYSLTVVGEHNIVLYPWRFSDDAYSPLSAAKMRLSKTREQLLGLTPPVSDQLSFEHAELSEEELEAEFHDFEDFLDDAAQAGRVVIIAYASNPHAGVLRAYWGDASRADDSGHLLWSDVAEIPRPDVSGAATSGTPVRPAGPVPVPNTTTAARFDQAPMGEIPLAARNPLAETDGGQTPAPQPETGSDG